MKIGIDAHMLGDHSGGNESYLRLIRAYRSLREDGKITHQLVIAGKKACVFDCI